MMYLTMQELISNDALSWVGFAGLIVFGVEGMFIFIRYHAMGEFPFDSGPSASTMGIFEMSYLMFSSNPPNIEHLPDELGGHASTTWAFFGGVLVVLYLLYC